MGSKQYQDPFTGEPEDPFGPPGPVDHGPHPALPANEQEVGGCLLSKGIVSHEVGDGASRLEIRTRLSGNNREWRYRVAVFSDGKEIEDPLGVYPTERRFPRDLGADHEDSGDGSAHRHEVAQHAARCHLNTWIQAHQLLPKKGPWGRCWLWILAILVLASAVATTPYFLPRGGPVGVPPAEEQLPEIVVFCIRFWSLLWRFS